MVTETRPIEETRSVDLLISGADVVTFDDAGTEVLDGAIAVTGNQIHWVGPAAEAATRFLPRQTIDGRGMIAMPGFVDAHVHIAQQFLHSRLPALRRRGELKNPIWSRYLIPFESGMEPEDILERHRRICVDDRQWNHVLSGSGRPLPR